MRESTFHFQLQERFSMVDALLQVREKQFPSADESVTVQANRFALYIAELPDDASQYVRVCPHCFTYEEVGHAAMTPAMCGHCGIRMRHAPDIVLDALLADIGGETSNTARMF